MIVNKQIEKLPKSAVRLSVTVEKDAVKTEYGDLLKKYGRNARIRGFRPGHVPSEILEKKFGESIRQEASANMMEKALKQIFDEIEEKPLPYMTPELEGEFKPDMEKDLAFSVVYDVFPQVVVGTFKGLTVEEPDVSITEEDESRELKVLQEQNAIVVDKKDGAAAKNDIVTITYFETDKEGKEVPNTKREGFVFTVGSGYNLYKIDDDIVGMKKDEAKIITKVYPEDFEIEVLRGRTVTISVTVTAVKEKQLPELDDELAQDIDEKYKTLEDLKTDIRQKLAEALANRIKAMKVSDLIAKITDASAVELPKSMVALELEQMWRNFVSRLRGTEEQVLSLLKREGKSREELFNEWTPAAEKNAKTELVVHKLIEQESIQISDNEIDEEIAKEAKATGTPEEEMKARYADEHMREFLMEEMKKQKLYDMLINEAVVSKGAKRNFLDVMGNN